MKHSSKWKGTALNPAVQSAFDLAAVPFQGKILVFGGGDNLSLVNTYFDEEGQFI